VVTTSGTYPWSFGTQIFRNVRPNHGGNRKTFEVSSVQEITALGTQSRIAYEL